MTRRLFGVLVTLAAILTTGCLAGATIDPGPPVAPRPVAFIPCVPGATVTVSGNVITDNPTPITDANGNATFLAIPDGDIKINIVIVAAGYAPLQLGAFPLPPGAHQLILGNCGVITSPGLQIQLPALVPNRPFPPERGPLEVR